MGNIKDYLVYFWKGTDKLIHSLEDPGMVSTSILGKGDKVHHSVFGDGTVVDTDPDAGTVSVDFGAFGKRRVNPDLLSLL